MAAIKDVKIKCGHCGSVFRAGIQFGDTESMESAITSGNTQQCPSCGQMVHCNKENMAYTLLDKFGGHVPNDFINNKGR